MTNGVLGATILVSPPLLADVPYTLLKGAVYIHPTFAEGLFFLLDDVKPA